VLRLKHGLIVNRPIVYTHRVYTQSLHTHTVYTHTRLKHSICPVFTFLMLYTDWRPLVVFTIYFLHSMFVVMTTPDGHQISNQYLTLLLSYGNKHVPKMAIFYVMLSHFKNCILKTQINFFFVVLFEMILMHAYRTFPILNVGSCIIKIDNIWGKLWVNNIKRCVWQIHKITVSMFCYMPEKHCKLTNSQMVIAL